MARYFNKKEVELLAPAGTFEIFNRVIQSGADAVYFGGKILNMRMHRKDYNLTNKEMIDAIKIAHSLNKKVYVTVNNLFNQNDLNDAVEYLQFLNEIKPDALIIQDVSIFEILNNLNSSLNLHSSVMMNVHNLETIKALRKFGVSRVVASRDMELKTIKELHKQTDMEFEYFTHGDMCIAHGSHCLYSGVLFGKSSNRGLCMKPCRWNFKIKKDGYIYPSEYPMAVKDMYMYENIPEMIESGITSFKIEGRMRDSDYLVRLINEYSDSINRYIADPICYDRKKHANSMYENRKRDLSTGYAFGNPGLKNINRRYEGTGKFYSHGKVFSNPIEERELNFERISQIKESINKSQINISNKTNKPILSVRVNSFIQAKTALGEGVDVIYLSGDVFEPDIPFSKKEILDLTINKKNTKIYLGLPKMMYEEHFSKYHHLLDNNNLRLDGLLVTNLGSITAFRNLDLELIGDYSLNIYNHKASDFYKKQGLSSFTLSIEAPLKDAKETIIKSSIPTEVIVHGSPIVMYLEHDLYENTHALEPIRKENNKYVNNNILTLIDDKGNEHPVYRDIEGKNNITLYKEICYLPILKELNELGANRFRIEASHYDLETLKNVLKLYKKAIDDLNICNELFLTLNSKNGGFTLGSFDFD